MALTCRPRLGLSLLILAALRGNAATSVEQSTCTGDADAGAADCAAESSPLRADKPALALAEVYEAGIDVGDYLVSEKLDGVRAYWNGHHLITRGGLVINAPAWFTVGFPDKPLDGELWMGHGTFARVSGTVRRLEPELEAWLRVQYVLFDLPDGDASFEQRLTKLKRLVAASPSPYLHLAEQSGVADHDRLMAMLKQVAASGGEGLMLHRRDASYRPGRSSDLLKVKPYLEAEGRVIEHLPGRGKYQGMLGALLVEEPDGTRFRIGTGFSDAERANPPLPGTIVTFKYHGRTKYGLPRFASFLRVEETF